MSVALNHPDNLCIVHICDGGFSSHPSIVGLVVFLNISQTNEIWNKLLQRASQPTDIQDC